MAHHLAPGDSLVLSAAIRSLHLTYPGEYLVDLECTAKNDLYENNPDVTTLVREECLFATVHYDDINRCNQEPIHFMEAMCRGIANIIKRPVRLSTTRPVLVLSDQEKQWMGRVQELVGKPVPYALILSGGKQDYTTKHLGQTICQEVVDAFRGVVQFVQVGGIHDLHAPLKGTINQIGHTSVRELIRLAHHSQFAIGSTTLLQHIYAALQKPYIAVLGGREPRSWTHYPTQIDVTAHGSLPCCRTQSCWRSRVRPYPDNNANLNASLCELPTLMAGGEWVPRCVAMPGSAAVIEAVKKLIMSGAVNI